MTIRQSHIDLFSDETLADTQTVYRELREAGAIVYLPANDLYAITHFAAVKAALRADDALISSKGVAANDAINTAGSDATITSDGATHTRRRLILMRPLMPKSLHAVRERVEQSAQQLVQDLVSQDRFCGVKDFASHLPLSIVAELVGLEPKGRENMLDWASATFDALGPINDRTYHALPRALGLLQYVKELGPDRLRKGGWAEAIIKCCDAGEISEGEAAMMIIDYTAPSLDTTILASAHMLWRLGVTPGAYDALKEDPSLIPGVVNESVRLASPIRGFTRYAQAAYESEHGTIPAGARVAVLYASANWDDMHYNDADAFDVYRNPRDHVGWGHGPHICAGMHLARLEMEALLRALLNHVESINVEHPTPITNNVLQGFAALPTTFH
ncbi:MAG: cytochrome P450 [Pseudomonadota bacterium]